jgi:glutamine amidotransferase
VIDIRLAGGRPVLGVCVGMQVLFDGSDEPSAKPQEGLGEWPGTVARLNAEVVPHMGWSQVQVADDSALFAGLTEQRFYFVHSYAVQRWTMAPPTGPFTRVAPRVTWADHGGPFVAAIENGPLSATQFHPEKSGDAGLALLENWVRSL